MLGRVVEESSCMGTGQWPDVGLLIFCHRALGAGLVGAGAVQPSGFAFLKLSQGSECGLMGLVRVTGAATPGGSGEGGPAGGVLPRPVLRGPPNQVPGLPLHGARLHGCYSAARPAGEGGNAAPPLGPGGAIGLHRN